MGRAPCCDKASVKRGPWSPEEDAVLKAYIDEHGTGGNWIALPQKAGLKRCGKSCRLRWLNYLRPDIKHGGFTEEEDNIICALYNRLGSRWSVIASHMPKRTDNDVKNYWNTKLKKKLVARQTNSNPVTPSPTPPPPILPEINFSMPPEFSLYGLSQQQLAQKLYLPFSMASIMEHGPVVSPSEEVSAASSSIENSSSSNSYINWSTSGAGSGDDSFLAELGFGDTGDFFCEVTPCLLSAPETKAQGMYQSLTHS